MLIKLVVPLIVLIVGIAAWETVKANFFPKKEIISSHDIAIKIETLGKLELVKYKIKDVVEYEVIKRFMPNTKAVLMIAGEAVGCIDLQKIKQEDISEQGETITVILPKPELCYVKINHSESKVYDTKFAIFEGATLLDKAYKEAEKQLEKTVLASSIMQETRQTAEIILAPMLETFAKKKVVLKFKD